MHSSLRLLRAMPLFAAAALACGPSLAQQDPAVRDADRATGGRPSPYAPPVGTTTAPAAFTRADGYSILPWTRRGYIGINLGQSDYGDFGCGGGGFGCDDNDTRVHVYTGGMFNDWLGLEIGYLNEGKVDRAGGGTRSEGGNISLVGRVPLGAFNVFAKGGATYGRTKVSADALSGVTAGSRRGWGGSYGVGAGFDFTPSSGVVLEWSRHAFRVPGGGRRDVDGTSIGYVHRF